jgi:hypothetical protein
MATVAAIAVAASPPLFETLRWTESGAELEALSTQPATCLDFDDAAQPLVQAGHALFNTPMLLGGQAAKAGVSCASCHVNGRDNPHFSLAGVSDKAGSADVTNSFFSAARGNAKFDPATIPDLAVPGKVPREDGNKVLDSFIRDLIVEEFSGAEPSETELEALAAYVRAIRACPDSDKTLIQRSLTDQTTIIRSALTAATAMEDRGDRQKEVGRLIAAARHQLGLISERYAGPALKSERALLLKASRELQAVIQSDNQGKAITQWQSQFNNELARSLQRKESASLYNPQLLARGLKP